MDERPDNCMKCRVVFLKSPALRMEIQHEAFKHGQSAAEALLNERLMETHNEHRNGNVR